MNKSTNIELVAELQELNAGGNYDTIIENAKSGRYHDFKNPEDVVCGKVELLNDLLPYPELQSIRYDVMDGKYDEPMDEEDKAIMRSEIPHTMWGNFRSFGLGNGKFKKEEYQIINAFMGYEITSGGMIIRTDALGNRWGEHPLIFKKYNTSWEDLMEVVAAIENYKKLDGQWTYNVVIKCDACYIQEYMKDDEVVLCVGGPSKISRVYSCVLQFIKLVG